MPQEYYETSMMVVWHNLKVHQHFVLNIDPVSLKPNRSVGQHGEYAWEI